MGPYSSRSRSLQGIKFVKKLKLFPKGETEAYTLKKKFKKKKKGEPGRSFPLAHPKPNLLLQPPQPRVGDEHSLLLEGGDEAGVQDVLLGFPGAVPAGAGAAEGTSEAVSAQIPPQPHHFGLCFSITGTCTAHPDPLSYSNILDFSCIRGALGEPGSQLKWPGLEFTCTDPPTLSQTQNPHSHLLFLAPTIPVYLGCSNHLNPLLKVT